MRTITYEQDASGERVKVTTLDSGHVIRQPDRPDLPPSADQLAAAQLAQLDLNTGMSAMLRAVLLDLFTALGKPAPAALAAAEAQAVTLRATIGKP